MLLGGPSLFFNINYGITTLCMIQLRICFRSYSPVPVTFISPLLKQELSVYGTPEEMWHVLLFKLEPGLLLCFSFCFLFFLNRITILPSLPSL